MNTAVIKNPRYPSRPAFWFCLTCWNQVAAGKFYCSTGCESRQQP